MTNSSNTTFKLVMTALMTALITISTMTFKVPIPFTQGYVHLGDAMIFFSVLLLGWKYGSLAAAVGSALGDILGGFSIWAPWTFVVKGGMAFLTGVILFMITRKAVKAAEELDLSHGDTIKLKVTSFFIKKIIAMFVGGIFMLIGYYVAEGVIYGNWFAPILALPWNLGQFATGIIIATILGKALCKTPLRNMFEFPI